MMSSGYDPQNNQNNNNNFNNNNNYNNNPGYNNNTGGDYQRPNNNINPVSTPIIVNNQSPDIRMVIVNNAGNFKTSSITATCPTCKLTAPTKVTTTLSCSNLLCYICFDPLIWIIYQLVRQKDINCCDATHNCPSCGGYVASYNSC